MTDPHPLPWRPRRAWSLVALAGLAAAAAVLVGPLEIRDTASYLDGAAYRTALYPTFLAALSVFGALQLHAAVALQVLFGLWAGARLLQALRRQGLAPWPTGCAAALFALPYFWPLQVGNSIASEGLAYPLFLLATTELIAALHGSTWHPIGRFAAWAALGALARPQLLFLLPAGAIVLTWQLLRRRDRGDGPRLAAPTALAVAALAAVWLIECGYHRSCHGEFALAPFAEIQWTASALYISSSDDADTLPETDRRLFEAMRGRAAADHLLLADNPFPGGVASFATHYASVYNDIVWGTVMPELRESMAGGNELAPSDYFAAARRLRPMTIELTRRHLATWSRLVLSTLLNGLGTSFALLILLTLPLAAARSHVDRHAALLLAAAVLHLGNLTLVSLIQVARLRYSFYTDALYLVALLGFMTSRRTEG